MKSRPTYRPSINVPWTRWFTDERAQHLRALEALYHQVERNYKASVWSRPDALQIVAQTILENVTDDPPPEAVTTCLVRLLAAEEPIFADIDLDWSTAVLSMQERNSLNRFLRAREYFLANADAVIESLAEHLQLIVKELIRTHPKIEGTATATVPLHALAPDLPKMLKTLIQTGATSQAAEKGIFIELHHRLYTNLCKASGIVPYEETKKQYLFPAQQSLSSEELIELYMGSTAFFDFFNTQVPFVIPRKTYAEHGALFAKSGHGKTQTLRAILSGFLQEHDPPALFIIDSLGSLIDGIADLEVFQGRLKDRLVILDPSDPHHLPALNFFKLQSDDLSFYLFKAIDQSFTQRQATMISYLMEFMRNVDNANLLTLITVCESKQNLYPNTLQKLSPFAKSFFENQFYAKKPDPLVQQTKNQIASRIYTLARMPTFEQIFSAAQNVFDPYRCMQEKKICLINTDARPPRLGGLGEASGVFGRFILALCLDAARGRPKNERHLALLIVDEAKHYMDEHAALILSDARQFGLGMILASQFPHQLEEGVRREINTNTSIRFMGPVEFAVASQYARDMFTTPDFIMGMKSIDRSHAEWAAYVANITDRAVKLTVPYGVLEGMPKIQHVAPARDVAAVSTALSAPAAEPDVAQNFDIKPGKEW